MATQLKGLPIILNVEISIGIVSLIGPIYETL